MRELVKSATAATACMALGANGHPLAALVLFALYVIADGGHDRG
ncbi:hypothetical protein [Metapseudomonas otitidis]|nr:hypothetical protein [Pseudomonas otitidis]